MADLISIIIPCYNVAEDIAVCLDSVLAQSYKNIEVVCVNDGSKDDTGKVLSAYAEKDTRVKVIHQENGGVTKARFAGLDAATGTWIGFVDGDDIIDSDMYERLHAGVTDEVDISHCGYKKVFPEGEIEYYYDTGKKVVQDNYTGLVDLLQGAFVEPGLVNKLYRKDLFIGLQDWLDTSIKINEDLLMNYYLFRGARGATYEDFCPYHYLVRTGSASASRLNDNKLYDPLRVLDILDKETADEQDLNRLVKSRIAYLLISGATRKSKTQKELVRPYVKEMRRRLRASLKDILRGPYTKKIKLSALWVRIWPASYRWVHSLYFRSNKKYKKYKEIYTWL